MLKINERKNIGQQICEQVKLLIEKRRLAPGERLPSLRELANELGIHRHTISNSFDDLVSEGWLESIERSGYYVALEIPTDFFETKNKKNSLEIKKFEFDPLIPFKLPSFAPNENISFNFQSGLPDLRLMPRNELKKIYTEVLREASDDIFKYGDTLGHEALTEQLTKYLKKTRQVREKTIAVTNGSQEALYIISQILFSSGDGVVVEEIGYAPARATFQAAGADIITIKNLIEAKNLKELEKVLKSKNVKAIFLTPLHHFPTCRSLSISKRLQIYQLCQKYGVFIIEDDYDHEMHYSPPPPPMAADDPSNLVIYLSTFSKAISPSLRMGLIAMPDSLAVPFAQYRRILTHQNERISQEVMARYIQRGHLSRHLRRVRRIYQKRRDIIVKELQSLQNDGLDIEFEIPTGGLALWLNIKRDSKKFTKKALSLGVFLLPESGYHDTGKSGTYIRLGFSNQNEEELVKGIRIIKKLL